MKLDLLIRDGRLCREDLPPARSSIGVRDGRIAVVAATSDSLEATEVIDASGRLVMPGMMFSTNVARIFGLYPRKGTLATGADGDVIVVDDETDRVVEARALHSRSDFSIYEGQRLTGWPTHVVSRGRVVLRDGTLVAARGGGRFLRAPGAGA